MADQLWKISCLTILLMFITITVFDMSAIERPLTDAYYEKLG